MARDPHHTATLRNLRGIWIDSGSSDDYWLNLGATAFRHALGELGVPDDVIHFELFRGTHSGLTWRYPLALSWLVERLS